ncbi:MAG: hypothetical protein MK185_06755 [Saccharospirillaceae bacterium]|nr:hypothetical protein [Saccharospirillaceae bacterium]
MTDTFFEFALVLIVCFLAGYGLIDLIFSQLFGIKLVINDPQGNPVKYRLKNGKLRRIGS